MYLHSSLGTLFVPVTQNELNVLQSTSIAQTLLFLLLFLVLLYMFCYFCYHFMLKKVLCVNDR